MPLNIEAASMAMANRKVTLAYPVRVKLVEFKSHDRGPLCGIGDFTVTSFAVSRGHPAPLVGKRLLAGGLRVYFCLDSCLVYINFAHTQDHDYVLYLCGGTSGVVWTACFSLLSSKKMENEENSG